MTEPGAAGAEDRARERSRQPPGRRPTPAPEQRAAIDDRGRDLFLAAGAGTGKTTVLVERFCDAVCAVEGDDAGVGVENVLAFTFTERAAGELKRRIRAELGRRADAASDPRAARRLRSLARDSESAWVSTIHSFCQRALSADPLGAGLDPGFRVLDETEAARVGAEAFDAAFERFGARGGEGRFEMAAAFRVAALRTIVQGAYGELRSGGAERPSLPELAPPDVDGAVSALRAAAEAALAASVGGSGRSAVDDRRALIAAAVNGTSAGTPTEDEVASWSFSKIKGLELPEVSRYLEVRAALECRLVEERFADHYEHLRELLELYGEEYARRKEERSALDFEDLQLRARRLLRDRSETRRRYQRQFRHLMVDEFQDTNALQLDVLRLLHEDGGVRQNRLFTVGDELQSIYAFRHADVEVFRSQATATGAAPEEDAAVRRLAGNFRSRPEVLALVNQVGRSLFGSAGQDLAASTVPGAWAGRAEGPRRAGSTGERSTGSAPDTAVELLLTEREGWEEGTAALEVSPDERAQPWRVAEARFIADRLAELRERGVAPRDMVVLLRSFRHVEAYEDALEAADLAPYVVGGRGYWSKQQVTDARNLLACVANPLDDKALLGVLASPACGVSSDALWLLGHAAGRSTVWSALRWLFGPDGTDPAPEAGDRLREWRERAEELARHVPSGDAGALRELVGTLLDLRREGPLLSLEALIDRAITATGYDLALLMRTRGGRRMANVRKLMRLAREFEAREGRDLRAFVDFIDSETAVATREAEAAVAAEGHQGVGIMTVHAAKGLEFPVVVVGDLGRQPPAGAGPALRLEPTPLAARGGDGDAQALRVGLRLARLGRKQTPVFDYAELQERALEREREEERRILHVAMTRAEERLILSGAIKLEKLEHEPKPTDPLIGPVLHALGWDGEEASVELRPPPLPPGLGGNPPPVRVAIRKRTPGDPAPAPVAQPASDRPEGERPVRPGPDPEGRPGDGAAKAAAAACGERLPDPELAPPASPPLAPVRSVSYSALSLYERCGYRFYAERVLGMRPRVATGASVRSTAVATEGGEEEGHRPRSTDRGDERHGAASLSALARRYAGGRVVHELLERSARGGWCRPDPEHAAALLAREGVAAERGQVDRAVRLVEGFLSAPIRSELEGAASIQAEAPFAFRAGDLVVRGEIDLLADLGEETLVVDYKSDALDGKDPGAHMERYEAQRLIYAAAALGRYGKPVRVVYVFLERPGAPVETRFEPAAAAEVRRRLDALAGGIRAGRFEVTDRPARSLCLDCPARERLCVHGPERTLRERPPA